MDSIVYSFLSVRKEKINKSTNHKLKLHKRRERKRGRERRKRKRGKGRREREIVFQNSLTN